MLFRSPRLSAIVKKVNDMTLDTIADHIVIYGMENQIKDLIFKKLQSKKSNEPMHIVCEMMQHLPIKTILKLKITQPDSISEIRKLLIIYLKERNV